jgi:C4-dicarboxylate transporter DctM subunit
MPPIIIGVIGLFVLFFLLFVMRFQVATGMAIVGVAGIWYLSSGNAAISRLSIIPFSTITNYSLTTLPLYVFMACILTNVRFGNDLYTACSRWIGHVRGGLAASSTVAMAVLGAVSPTSLANLTIMGRMAYPEMVKRNYDQKLASGCIAAGAGLGSIIPPSGPLIIYGVMTGVSIGRLFIAGILPGIMLPSILIVTIGIMCALNPKLAPAGKKYDWRGRFVALGGCFEILLLILFMLYGITVGWFTPNEAAATGCVVAILSTFIIKRFSWKMLTQSLADTLQLSGMLYLMLIGVFIFTAFLVTSQVSVTLAELVNDIHFSRYVIVGFIIVIYLILGTFMDVPSMIALTIPIFFPVVTSLGFSGIWFGIIIALLGEIANITPPTALNVWILAGILRPQGTSMETIYKGILPFLAVEVAFLFILLFFPQIALFLPSLMK